jgi:isopenicillin N synthase-like dioxygenase
MRIVTLKEYPPIDLARFSNGSERDKDQILNELDQRLKEFGFMVFKNYGVSLKTLWDTYGAAKRFFANPMSVKQKYLGPTAGLNGYFTFLSEKAVKSEHPDLKEFWHVLRQTDPDDLRVTYPPNRWPSENPDFQTLCEELYRQMDRCAIHIMELFDRKFGRPQGYFQDLCKNGCSTLRLIHYPPIAEAPKEGQMRAGLHTGIQLIGLQPPATHPGLEFLLPSGEWIRLSEEFDDYMSVNIGDMLEAMSGFTLKATPHRVVNPRGQEANEDRYAIVYFYHAHPLVEIKSLVPSERNFQPIPAHAWLQQRIDQISRSNVAEAD